jgi:hypothetical protein
MLEIGNCRADSCGGPRSEASEVWFGSILLKKALVIIGES